jgi:hypothetical protein
LAHPKCKIYRHGASRGASSGAGTINGIVGVFPDVNLGMMAPRLLAVSCEMGVTIHFEGQLLGRDAFNDLISATIAFSESRVWLTELIESEKVTLLRIDENEKEWNYMGPARGITVYPSEDCDPIHLQFDKDLYVQEYVKTQFAGVETHLAVLDLLRIVKPFFSDLKVYDEGEYWETSDIHTLRDHMERVQHVIDEEKKNNPSAQVKVKTPDGRIMDLMT